MLEDVRTSHHVLLAAYRLELETPDILDLQTNSIHWQQNLPQLHHVSQDLSLRFYCSDLDVLEIILCCNIYLFFGFLQITFETYPFVHGVLVEKNQTV